MVLTFANRVYWHPLIDVLFDRWMRLLVSTAVTWQMVYLELEEEESWIDGSRPASGYQPLGDLTRSLNDRALDEERGPLCGAERRGEL